jgi:hypothetical protein
MSSRPVFGSTQPLNQWVPGALSPEVKRPGREAAHSPPVSAKVKENVDLYIHSPIRLYGVVFKVVKHRNNFTFQTYPSSFQTSDSKLEILTCNVVMVRRIVP